VPNQAFIMLPPDWVCEILSPSTERIDREKKLRIYARDGVGHAWLVDPIARTLEAMRLAEGRWLAVTTLKDDALAQVEPFDAVAFPLTRLWPEP
jgi:Uma2 family endonuclease